MTNSMHIFLIVTCCILKRKYIPRAFHYLHFDVRLFWHVASCRCEQDSLTITLLLLSLLLALASMARVMSG